MAPPPTTGATGGRHQRGKFVPPGLHGCLVPWWPGSLAGWPNGCPPARQPSPAPPCPTPFRRSSRWSTWRGEGPRSRPGGEGHSERPAMEAAKLKFLEAKMARAAEAAPRRKAKMARPRTSKRLKPKRKKAKTRRPKPPETSRLTCKCLSRSS